jgi:hypothetical protein
MGRALSLKEDASMRSIGAPLIPAHDLGVSGKGKGRMDSWAANFLQESALAAQRTESVNLQAIQTIPSQSR